MPSNIDYSKLITAEERAEQARQAQIPASITPLQARKGLRAWGIGRSQIRAFFDTIADPAKREMAEDAWEYAVQIDRDNPLIAGCATFLGKTAAEVDQFFVDAKRL